PSNLLQTTGENSPTAPAARLAEGGPSPAYYSLYSRRLDGPRSRRRQQAGSQNDRPRRQAARVYAAEQPPFPSRRNGALHQRQNPRHWRVFQRTKRRTGESVPE